MRFVSPLAATAVVSLWTLTGTAAMPATAAPLRADLHISAGATQLQPGQAGVQRVTVDNSGPAAAPSVLLTYVTPMYVNIDRSQPLPAGCRMKLTDPDPYIPEIVTCTLPTLGRNAHLTVGMPLKVTTTARFTGPDYPMAMVRPQGVQEANITDNWTTAPINLVQSTTAPAKPAGHLVDLWTTSDIPPLSAGHRGQITFLYGNKGPRMRGTTQFTFVTPFYVNVDHTRALPPGCTMRLRDADPMVPEVVHCAFPGLSAGQQRRLVVPLALVAGGPHGVAYSMAVIAPDNIHDVERDQSDNVAGPGVLNISPVT